MMRSSNRVMSFPVGTMVKVKGYPFVLRDDVAVMGEPENFGAAMCELAKAEQIQDQAMVSLKCDSVCVVTLSPEQIEDVKKLFPATGGEIVATPTGGEIVAESNSEQKLWVYDDLRGTGVKGRFYTAKAYHQDGESFVSEINFQDGPVSEHGVNGLTNEALLAILIHRTQILNEQFPCNENSEAIALMTKAKHVFESRTKRRQAAGIEGKMVEQATTDSDETAPKQVQLMDFSEALAALKCNQRVARFAWNGQWLSMSCNGTREVVAENFWSQHNKQFAAENGGKAAVMPSITMQVNGEIMMGWTPSQLEMFAKDWIVL